MGKLLTKERKRAFLLAFLPPIVYLFMRLLYLSCKKRFYLPDSIEEPPFMIAFWHGEILMNPFIYKEHLKDLKIALMISDHFDGELISKSVKYFGFKTIRGSTYKGAVKALKKSFKMLDEGYCIAITPDGPRGPRHSIADGIISIAKKRGLKIVTASYTASSKWELNSWDKFVIPKPFSTLKFYLSRPIDISNMTKEEAKSAIKRSLLKNV